MRKKKHNSDEIRYCQSQLHKMVYEFKNGERSYLVSVEWEGNNPLRMVVCEHCYANNVGILVKEVIIDNPRVPVMQM